MGWGVAPPGCRCRGLGVTGWDTHLLEGHGQVWLRHPQHPCVQLPHRTHPRCRLVEARANCDPKDRQERDGGGTSGMSHGGIMLLPTRPREEHPFSEGAGAEGPCGEWYGQGLSHQHRTTSPGTRV